MYIHMHMFCVNTKKALQSVLSLMIPVHFPETDTR